MNDQGKNFEHTHRVEGEESWAAAGYYSNLSFSADRAKLALLLSTREPRNPLLSRGFQHGLRLCEMFRSGAEAISKGIKKSEQLALVKAVESLVSHKNETVDQLAHEAQRVATILQQLAEASHITEEQQEEATKFFEEISDIYGTEARDTLERLMEPTCF